MARPGDTVHRLIRVSDSTTGAAVTGLVLANFAVEAYTIPLSGGTWATYAHGATLTEIGGGRYALAFALPPASGFASFLISHATHDVRGDLWEGEVEQYDQDALAAATIGTTATLSTSAQLGSVVPLELVHHAYREITITITDTAQSPINLSGYTNWRMSVSGQDQTVGRYDQTTGISGNASGVLSIIIPESATALWTFLAAAANSVTLFWDVWADKDGQATQSQPIVRSSPCTITRREVQS